MPAPVMNARVVGFTAGSTDPAIETESARQGSARACAYVAARNCIRCRGPSRSPRFRLLLFELPFMRGLR